MPLRFPKICAVVPAVVLAAACRSADVAPPPAAALPKPEADRAVAAARADAGAPGAERGGAPVAEGAAAPDGVGELVERLARSPVVGARPVSPRSLSVRIALASGDRAAFKPLRKESRSARWEVAFYALSGLVGARRVPPSTLRLVPLAQLLALLGPGYPELAAALRDGAQVDGRGLVGGAAIAWIDDLAPARFDGADGRALLRRWLAPGGPGADAEPLAAEASRLIVADYVLGNWDRFSGGNLFESRSGRALWLIDNNGSFAPWSDRQRERMDGQLLACSRFSRAQVEGLRALTAGAVRDALRAEEERGIVERLLDDGEVATLLARRDQVLRRVDALVAAGDPAGDPAAVLAFP